MTSLTASYFNHEQGIFNLYLYLIVNMVTNKNQCLNCTIKLCKKKKKSAIPYTVNSDGFLTLPFNYYCIHFIIAYTPCSIKPTVFSQALYTCRTSMFLFTFNKTQNSIFNKNFLINASLMRN